MFCSCPGERVQLLGSGWCSGDLEKWVILRHIFKVEAVVLTVELSSGDIPYESSMPRFMA